MTELKRIPWPPVDPKLIERLAAKYPNRVPLPDDTDREIWMSVGRQEVITYMRAILIRSAKENLAT